MASDVYSASGVPQDPKEDHLIRAIARKGHVKAIAINTTATVREMQRIHNTSNVVTAALGRFITASLLVASNMKNEDDTQTTIIRSDGPIGGMTCVVDSKGHAKAYALETNVEATYHCPGKLNVGAAVGRGSLTLIIDIGLREPYTGSVELVSGEIAEDFTYFLASSEQTPSIVSLGVQIGTDGIVSYAGGMMIQIMPNATEEDISYVEGRVNGFPAFSELMEDFSVAQILDLFMGYCDPDNDPENDVYKSDLLYLDGYPVSYKCNCSRERMSQGLAALGRRDLESLAEDVNGIDAECHFCDKKYHFSPADIQDMLDNM